MQIDTDRTVLAINSFTVVATLLVKLIHVLVCNHMQMDTTE